MAQSPTSNSTPLNNAAKDDAVGLDGNYTFTIADLLANDPGGAAKVDVDTQFFFGSTPEDQANQAQYLLDHGITDNGDGTYTIEAGATDFQYFVQIGNKGTWSIADVDVTAPVPHAGDLLFWEDFDGYINNVDNPLFGVVDLNVANDWTGAAHTELGANGYGGIATTSGDATSAYWLDTQNSPGPINISHEFTDTTDAVGGVTSKLSFDIAIQSLDYNGQHYETGPNASIQFRMDGVTVAQINAADFESFNTMKHVEVNIGDYANDGATHTLELVDVTVGPGSDNLFTGFAVDSIQINDWIV
jgi:hypothetical protein